MPCDVVCETCGPDINSSTPVEGNGQKCLTCNFTTGYPYFNDNQDTCHDVCPDGKYGNDTNNFCETCHSICKNCIYPGGEYNCTYCRDGDFLHNNTCVNQCGPFANFSNPENNTC